MSNLPVAAEADKVGNLEGEYCLYRVVALVCEACLMGEPSECHTPGCVFWMCSAINQEQGERLRNALANGYYKEP